MDKFSVHPLSFSGYLQPLFISSKNPTNIRLLSAMGKVTICTHSSIKWFCRTSSLWRVNSPELLCTVINILGNFCVPCIVQDASDLKSISCSWLWKRDWSKTFKSITTTTVSLVSMVLSSVVCRVSRRLCVGFRRIHDVGHVSLAGKNTDRPTLLEMAFFSFL